MAHRSVVEHNSKHVIEMLKNVPFTLVGNVQCWLDPWPWWWYSVNLVWDDSAASSIYLYVDISGFIFTLKSSGCILLAVFFFFPYSWSFIMSTKTKNGYWYRRLLAFTGGCWWPEQFRGRVALQGFFHRIFLLQVAPLGSKALYCISSFKLKGPFCHGPYTFYWSIYTYLPIKNKKYNPQQPLTIVL